MMAHAGALSRRGVRVVVATPDFLPPGQRGEPPQPIPLPGVEHVLLETAWMPIYRKNFCMGYSIANLRKLVELIRRVRPDCVHGTQEAAMQVLVTACLICNVPLTVAASGGGSASTRDRSGDTLGCGLKSVARELVRAGASWERVSSASAALRGRRCLPPAGDAAPRCGTGHWWLGLRCARSPVAPKPMCLRPSLASPAHLAVAARGGPRGLPSLGEGIPC